MQNTKSWKPSVIYENVFSQVECQNIISNAKLGQTFADRSGYLKRCPENVWIARRIMELSAEANKNFFNFSISEMQELFLLRISPEKLFNWKADIGKGNAASRKLSIRIFLSEPETYQGGRFTFNLARLRNPQAGDIEEISHNQGSVLFYPSFRTHYTERLIRGESYVLTAFLHGNSFQ